MIQNHEITTTPWLYYVGWYCTASGCYAITSTEEVVQATTSYNNNEKITQNELNEYYLMHFNSILIILIFIFLIKKSYDFIKNIFEKN